MSPSMLRRTLLPTLLVAASLAGGAIEGATARPPDERAGVTLTFVDPIGTPLANAEVSVYLTPFDPPAEYTPLLLAGGTADPSGVFTGTLRRSGVPA